MPDEFRRVRGIKVAHHVRQTRTNLPHFYLLIGLRGIPVCRFRFPHSEVPGASSSRRHLVTTPPTAAQQALTAAAPGQQLRWISRHRGARIIKANVGLLRFWPQP